VEEHRRSNRGEVRVAKSKSGCRRELQRATCACAQNVATPKVNHRTEVNNQKVVGETSVLLSHCVLHFVQDKTNFDSKPCPTQ
jgi:hypothetical protein